MKRLAIILFSAVILSACDRIYINGALDGMWQLQLVEENDGTTAHPHRIYYSFQQHLAKVSQHYEYELPYRFLCNLDYTGDSIKMKDFIRFEDDRNYPDKIAGNVPQETLDIFYIESDPTAFKILTLNDEMLILQSKNRKYTLQKW